MPREFTSLLIFTKLSYATGAHLLDQFHTHKSYISCQYIDKFPMYKSYVFNVYIQPALCFAQITHFLISSSLRPMAHLHAYSDHPSTGSHAQEPVSPMIASWLLTTMTLVSEATSF